MHLIFNNKHSYIVITKQDELYGPLLLLKLQFKTLCKLWEYQHTDSNFVWFALGLTSSEQCPLTQSEPLLEMQVIKEHVIALEVKCLYQILGRLLKTHTQWQCFRTTSIEASLEMTLWRDGTVLFYHKHVEWFFKCCHCLFLLLGVFWIFNKVNLEIILFPLSLI